MLPPPLLRLSLLALATLAQPALRAETTPAETPPAAASPAAAAWQDASVGLFSDALLAFQKLEGADARYGEALGLLMRQPKTAGNVDRAAEMLSALVAAEPDSETGIAARYHLGRIEQTHRMTPDPVAARRVFQELVAAHPAHPYAQQAVVKLAIIDLYERVPADTRRARFDAFVEQTASLSDPVARRDLRLLLADAAQRFDYPALLALDLLVGADEDGIARRAEQANVWVRIGILAAENKRPEIARAYFEKFLATYIRDSRRLPIEEMLANLPPATPTQTTSAEAAR
jgi:tetratricopeptide (TPR) repeat protein